MKVWVPGLWFAFLGVFFLAFRSWIGAQAVEWNYRILRIRFSQRGYELSFTVLGLIFLAIGILAFFGLLIFQP